jgi:hypothetical protein
MPDLNPKMLVPRDMDQHKLSDDHAACTSTAGEVVAMTESQSRPGQDPKRPIWIPALEPNDNAMDVALKYAEAGWRVVPAERDAHDHNSTVKDAVTNASRDPHRIAQWFLGNDFAIIAVCDVAETYVANTDAIPLAAHGFDTEAVNARRGPQR